MSDETRSDSPEARPRFEWTRLRVITFAVAGILILGGVALGLFGGGGADTDALPTGPTGTGDPGLSGNSLLPGSGPGTSPSPETGETGETGETPSSVEDSETAWSPALIKGGISFFAAFALAFAFRSFLKLALIVLGLWFAVLFYLSWLGWIEVHWDVIDAAFTGWTATLGDQFQSVQAFITGSLPSAGMAGLGLYTGFRRK
jgi:uncharacterized membrane protein (Fun14 family)